MASTRNNNHNNDNNGRHRSNENNNNNNHHHHRGGINRNRNNRFHRNRSMTESLMMQDYSQDWLDAIHKSSTSCLQNHNSTMDDLNTALNYLNKLEAHLLVKERKWHYPPNMRPPPLPGSTTNAHHHAHPSDQPTPFNTSALVPPSTILVSPLSNISSTTKTSNRYALFQDDEDDDDDDDDEEEEDIDATTVADDVDEAGDQITFHPQNAATDAATKTNKAKEPYIAGMDMRRIMIRIYNAQSDVFSAQAFLYRKQYPPEWLNGANKYSHCLHKIHSALLLADTEISKWMSYMYKKNSRNNRRNHHQEFPSMYTNRIVELLTEDAEIVQVAVQTMTANRDQYVSAAKQLEAKLLNKLRPQWRARDEAKERMGMERWTNNKNPKNDFSQLRIEYEQELNDIRKAIQYLLSSDLDTTVIEMESKLLHEKIQMGKEGPIELLPSSDVLTQEHQQDYHQPQLSMDGMETAQNTPQSEQQQHQLQRYNGMRPTDLSRRVDVQLYPDPTLFGWIFTGSHGVTEFFEISNHQTSDEIIKLDWYYTTGTIKTSMNHPVQGYTQLFAARVDPDTYRAILQDPRAHTGQRYRQRRHRNHKNHHQNRH